jgi:hypothetical protein
MDTDSAAKQGVSTYCQVIACDLPIAQHLTHNGRPRYLNLIRLTALHTLELGPSQDYDWRVRDRAHPIRGKGQPHLSTVREETSFQSKGADTGP